jgi:hypothetical protein
MWSRNVSTGQGTCYNTNSSREQIGKKYRRKTTEERERIINGKIIENLKIYTFKEKLINNSVRQFRRILSRK